mgnify:FL=1
MNTSEIKRPRIGMNVKSQDFQYVGSIRAYDRDTITIAVIGLECQDITLPRGDVIKATKEEIEEAIAAEDAALAALAEMEASPFARLTKATCDVYLRGNKKSYDNGDEIARFLRPRALIEVYVSAACLLREDVVLLRQRYAHLNPGQQRMNLGNRIRGAARKAIAAGSTVADVIAIMAGEQA